MTQHRRRFKQPQPLEVRLAAELARLREQAKKTPPGIKREQLFRKARQFEEGLHMTQWLRVPGLGSTP
jgi:hypothetical protein